MARRKELQPLVTGISWDVATQTKASIPILQMKKLRPERSRSRRLQWQSVDLNLRPFHQPEDQQRAYSHRLFCPLRGPELPGAAGMVDPAQGTLRRVASRHLFRVKQGDGIFPRVNLLLLGSL